MRQLRTLCDSYGAAAVGVALQKFLDERPDLGCSGASLKKKWWFWQHNSETEDETAAKAIRLGALWNGLISNAVIEEVMVPRVALMILRPREVPDAASCSRKGRGDVPTKKLGIAQRIAQRPGERAFKDTLQQYSCALDTVARLRARVADKPPGAGPATAAEEGERNAMQAMQDLKRAQRSESEAEFGEDVFADGEVVSVWPEGDTEARQQEAAQHLEEEELSQAERTRRDCEDTLRNLRRQHPSLSASTTFRAIARLPQRLRDLIPEDLRPQYLCSCGRRVCICRHQVVALKLQVETLKDDKGNADSLQKAPEEGEACEKAIILALQAQARKLKEEINDFLKARELLKAKELLEDLEKDLYEEAVGTAEDEPAEPPAKQARTV